MRVQFVLAGLHRIRRGAEVAFESIAHQLALDGLDDITVVGSGEPLPGRAYNYARVPSIGRERFENWPSMPFFRNDSMYEEFTFATALMMSKSLPDVDVSVTCGYPYTNWALRGRSRGKKRPVQVFVTQNGDWPALGRQREYRFFSCDGLVCTNPTYWQRNHQRWFSTLIPNGIDTASFHPGAKNRARLGLPETAPIVLMVSALIPTKRVTEGIRAVASIPDAILVLAGDGPLRDEVDRLGAVVLPGRYIRRNFQHNQMADLYRSADAFLHTTIGESFGNVYIEALSCGLPVVAHDEAVTRWIFEDHAILVDTQSPTEIVEALGKALTVSPDRRAAGAAFALERYDWRIVATRYRQFFDEIIRRRGTDPVKLSGVRAA